MHERVRGSGGPMRQPVVYSDETWSTQASQAPGPRTFSSLDILLVTLLIRSWLALAIKLKLIEKV